jgi:hydroxymethylbilane synthase
MKKRIRIATRKSKLAIQQTNYICHLIQDAYPKMEVEIVGVTTTGDRSAQSPSSSLSGKGDFLKEIESELLNESVDLAIHSMKDIPSIIPDGLVVQAIAPRQDPSDALVGVSTLNDLPVDARIGTSSCRRRALLCHAFNRTNVQDIRGNVDTRLKKLQDGSFDALVLASSGLIRLGLDNKIGFRLDSSVFVPAAGQGQLAAEYRMDDKEISKLVATLEVADASHASRCERDVINKLGADCTTPIGVYCQPMDQGFHIDAIVVDPDGEHSVRASCHDENLDKLASTVAESLTSMGARELIATT